MEFAKITVSKDFSNTPGPRFKIQGPFSGELFRESLLEPEFKKIKDNPDAKILVNLDCTLGYGTSFLEEVFGGLARIYDPVIVGSKIEIESIEEPYLKKDIEGYIRDAKNVKEDTQD
jgi:hypothetical protein